jgi:hypothetical protein
VSQLRGPWSYIPWLLLLPLPYFVFVARLRSEPIFDSTFHFPLAEVNQHLGGPSSVVMPICLIASWLALRPEALRRKWRLVATVVLVVLLLLTVYFLWSMGHRPYQPTVSSFVRAAGVLRTGPLLILAGAVLLLGSEYAAGGLVRRREGGPGEAKVAVPAPTRRYRVGFWSAVVACACSILPTLLMLFEQSASSMGRYDSALFALTGALEEGARYLLPVSVVVLVASICYYTPPGKTVWARMGLFFAVVYALTSVGLSVVSESYDLYKQVLESLPFLGKWGGLGAASWVFLGIALLLLLPVFVGGRIQSAVRWCFVVFALLVASSALGYLLSAERIALVPSLLGAIAEWLVFPVAMALVAVSFQRLGSGNGLKSDEHTD